MRIQDLPPLSRRARNLLAAALLVCIGLALASTLSSCATERRPPSLPSANRIITVRLAELSGARRLELSTVEGIDVIDQTGHTYRFRAGTGGGLIAAEVSGDRQISLPGLMAPINHARVRSLSGGPVTVAGQRYDGEITLGARDGELVVLNRLPLDDYLVGVLPGEVPLSWAPAALEAQAIAARSYALYEALHRSVAQADDPLRFDVHDDVRSQVYRGLEVEDERARAAVVNTHGLALLESGDVVHAYFHSTCGGQTADAADVLGEPPSVALTGRRCGHCTSSKYYRWQGRLLKTEAEISLTPLLRAAGGDPARHGHLRMLRPGRVDRAGRMVTIICDLERAAVEISAPKARLALGPSVLRSLLCVFRDDGDGVQVDGNGWGHGVGLCQIGASELAQQGYSAVDIVSFYYTGASVSRLPESSSAP